MLSELTAWLILAPLPAAPPHLSAKLRCVNSARPIKVLSLSIVLRAVFACLYGPVNVSFALKQLCNFCPHLILVLLQRLDRFLDNLILFINHSLLFLLHFNSLLQLRELLFRCFQQNYVLNLEPTLQFVKLFGFFPEHISLSHYMVQVWFKLQILSLYLTVGSLNLQVLAWYLLSCFEMEWYVVDHVIERFELILKVSQLVHLKLCLQLLVERLVPESFEGAAHGFDLLSKFRSKLLWDDQELRKFLQLDVFMSDYLLVRLGLLKLLCIELLNLFRLFTACS